jgi:nicotinamide-nucleotide amidase
MFPRQITEKSHKLLKACHAAGLRLATAESCTGGLIAGCLTAVPGSSSVFERGFVTYSNDSKIELLGVAAELIAEHGAVSEAVCRAMAEGALAHAHADLSVAVTGIAGPDGGAPDKPVGTVHIAVARHGRDTAHAGHHFPGDRAQIRAASVEAALDMLQEAAG